MKLSERMEGILEENGYTVDGYGENTVTLGKRTGEYDVIPVTVTLADSVISDGTIGDAGFVYSVIRTALRNSSNDEDAAAVRELADLLVERETWK